MRVNETWQFSDPFQANKVALIFKEVSRRTLFSVTGDSYQILSCTTYLKIFLLHLDAKEALKENFKIKFLGQSKVLRLPQT